MLAKRGDKVRKNAPPIAIKAMKMETRFCAPRLGVVCEVRFTADRMVERGDEPVDET